MELNPLSDISELREKFSASREALLLTILMSACQYSLSPFLSQNFLWDWCVNDDPAGSAVDEADGIVEIETVDKVGDVIDGVAV